MSKDLDRESEREGERGLGTEEFEFFKCVCVREIDEDRRRDSLARFSWLPNFLGIKKSKKSDKSMEKEEKRLEVKRDQRERKAQMKREYSRWMRVSLSLCRAVGSSFSGRESRESEEWERLGWFGCFGRQFGRKRNKILS